MTRPKAKRVTRTLVIEAFLSYALEEKRSTGFTGGLWTPPDEAIALLTAWGKQQDRMGYIRGCREAKR